MYALEDISANPARPVARIKLAPARDYPRKRMSPRRGGQSCGEDGGLTIGEAIPLDLDQIGVQTDQIVSVKAQKAPKKNRGIDAGE